MKRTLPLLLGAIALALGGYFAYHHLFPESVVQNEVPISGNSILLFGDDYMSGTGWSNHSHPDSAVLNAIAASEQGSPVEPDVTFLMFSNSFNTDSILKSLQDKYPNRKFFGWSIVYDLNVFPNGANNYSYHNVTAMSIRYPYLKTGISSGILIDNQTMQNAVNTAVEQAYADAGMNPEKEKPNKIILFSDGESKEIFSQVSEHFNNQVPVFGGWIEGDKIANFTKQLHGNNFVMALLFSEKNIAYDFRGGFSLTRNSGQVTKTRDGIIYEIDGRPSNEVYSEWCGRSVASIDTANWAFLNYSTLHPIYLKRDETEVEYYQFMHPVLDEYKNLQVQQHFHVSEGDTIYYAEGKYNLLINHLWKQPEYALINAPDMRASSALVFCCASYPVSIPPDQHTLLAQSLRMSLEGKPWLLTFTNGEHGYVPGIGNIYGNLMTGILIFPEP